MTEVVNTAGEDLSVEEVYLEVRKKKYVLRKQLILLQWEYLTPLIEGTGFKWEDFSSMLKKDEISLNITGIIKFLTKTKILPEILAIILVPEELEYWEEKCLNNSEDMKFIGDVDLIKVITNFFAGRFELIFTFLGFISNSLNTKEWSKVKQLFQKEKEA